MVAPVILWTCGIAAATTFAVQHLAKPRLPVYQVGIQNLFTSWPPSLIPTWCVDGVYRNRLKMHVTMHNDNFANLHVRSVTFDLFYMTWDGTLEHIGNVQDKNQVEPLLRERERQQRQRKEQIHRDQKERRLQRQQPKTQPRKQQQQERHTNGTGNIVEQQSASTKPVSLATSNSTAATTTTNTTTNTTTITMTIPEPPASTQNISNRSIESPSSLSQTNNSEASDNEGREEGEQPESSNTTTTTTTETTSTTSAGSLIVAETTSSSSPSSSAEEPLWKLPARGDFVIDDDMYVSTNSEGLGKVLTRFLYGAWEGRGSLLLPTTGVIHAHAKPTDASKASVPLTLSMVCDNVLNVWKLQITGLDCTLHKLDVLPPPAVGKLLPRTIRKDAADAVNESVLRVREYALTKLRPDIETGGVLQRYTMSSQWKRVPDRLAWEETMQMP